MKAIKFVVKEELELVDYLLKYSDYSRNKIKSLIKYNKILINKSNKIKLPYKLYIDDLIEINLEIEEKLPFEIIYEDEEILVVNKPYGLLTIGSLGEKYNTLYRLVKEYARKHKFEVFIVHRLDRDTSGIVMFAKNERIKLLYQNNWNELALKRGYITVVHGTILSDGRIDNLLFEEDNTFVHSSRIGKRAITNYRVLKSNKKYTMLDIDIETGRKNQIRVHMKEIGHPVVGDKKYGEKGDPIKRMALHSYELKIKHPINNNVLTFTCDYPNIFNKLVK